nr:hypothetical protein [uncultured Alistipes sp.]
MKASKSFIVETKSFVEKLFPDAEEQPVVHEHFTIPLVQRIDARPRGILAVVLIGVYGILTDGRPVAPIARSPPYCRNTAHVCISGDAQHADLRIPEPFDNVPAPTGCVMQDIIMHEAHDVAGASLHTFVVCLEYVVGMRTVVDYNQLIFTADCLVYVLLQLVRDVSCPAANDH